MDSSQLPVVTGHRDEDSPLVVLMDYGYIFIPLIHWGIRGALFRPRNMHSVAMFVLVAINPSRFKVV